MGLKRESFRDIDDRTEDLRDLAQEHPDIWKGFMERYELSWIYHENALEGFVLTHAEIVTALKGRPIAPDTYSAVRNQKLAIDQIRREAATEEGAVDAEMVRRLHALFGSDDPNYQPARLRKDIPLHRAYFHEIAQPNVIAGRLAKLMDWCVENDPIDDEDAVRFAAHMHHEYMSIFPFAEHTGRTGRLLVNYILLRHGYLPVLFHATERQRYYETLRHNRKDMESLLTDMMSNCVDNGVKFIQHELEERRKRQVTPLFAARG